MPSTPRRPRQFASDNHSGICPEAWDALAAANRDHSPAYGDDRWTRKATRLIREFFDTDCRVFFVFTGTAANSLALAACCRPYHSILTHEYSHIERDECAAPEFFTGGAKIRFASAPNGKLTPACVESLAQRRTVHFPKPGVVSVAQCTEAGTVYSGAELKSLGRTARRLGLRLHVDGARFANALASAGAAPADFTWKAGVDVISLGGSKNGMPPGEAVVFFNAELAREFEYRRKQAGQLCSKMRFLSAPWTGMLRDGAWLRHATHANRMAARLASGLRRLNGVKLLFPCQANAVFAELPSRAIRRMHASGWHFHVMIGTRGCRLMCSWDTSKEDVDSFLTDLKRAL
jgi:threonine aldolase